MISSKMSKTDETSVPPIDNHYHKRQVLQPNSRQDSRSISSVCQSQQDKLEDALADVGELAQNTSSESGKKRLGAVRSVESDNGSSNSATNTTGANQRQLFNLRSSSTSYRKRMAQQELVCLTERPLESHTCIDNNHGISHTSYDSQDSENLRDETGELIAAEDNLIGSSRKGSVEEGLVYNYKDEKEIEDEDFEEEDEEEEEDEDEEEEGKKKELTRRSSTCCEPFSTRISNDGISVTDVDLVSYKELCQLAHQQIPPTMDSQALVSHFNLPVVAVRRSSLQEESGAYYELCTSPEEQAIKQRYSWHPPSLNTLAEVDRFFEGFPTDKIPYVKTDTADAPICSSYREQQITYQLPYQDMSLEYCTYPLSESARAAYQQFIERRNNYALDVGSVVEINSTNSVSDGSSAGGLGGAQRCRRCLVRFEDGHLAVVAPNFVIASNLYKSTSTPAAANRHTNNLGLFHASCFNCSTCKEFLVDLVYCLRDNKLYCVRHYGESLRPRCSWCREVSKAVELS